MTWQPIETAPKDNSAVLLYVPMKTIHFVTTAFWDTVKQDWFVAWTGFGNPKAKVEGATHWMPLPAAPHESRNAIVEDEIEHGNVVLRASLIINNVYRPATDEEKQKMLAALRTHSSESRNAIVEALKTLCNEIEAGQEHGGDHDEEDCPLCNAVRAGRRALAVREREKEEYQ